MTQYDNDDFFERYKTLRSNPLSYNEIVEFPEMKRQMPPLDNKDVLDVGCGFGHLLKYISTHQPKSLTGIDVSEKMIAFSRQTTELKNASFFHGDILKTEINHTFDLIVSSLALHYIQYFNRLAEKLSGLLRPGGTLLFTIEHPIQTASTSQNIVFKDDSGLYLRLDHYFDESERTLYWNGADYKVSKYHHKIDTVINALIQSGLTIQYIKDMGDAPEVFQNYDEDRIHKLQTFPPFLMVKAGK